MFVGNHTLQNVIYIPAWEMPMILMMRRAFDWDWVSSTSSLCGLSHQSCIACSNQYFFPCTWGGIMEHELYQKLYMSSSLWIMSTSKKTTCQKRESYHNMRWLDVWQGWFMISYLLMKHNEIKCKEFLASLTFKPWM